jgi:P2 family phage contractile tail tube protein
MALPNTLKNYLTFIDGDNYAGEVEEIALPKLTRKTEEYRGAGMGGVIELDQGMNVLTMDSTFGGFMKDVFNKFGALQHDATQIRYTGAYRREGDTRHDTVEIVMRGRHKEIDMGNAKAGERGSFKVTTTLSYYKLSVNGAVLYEIDVVNMIEKNGGGDLMQDLKRALGL